MSQFDYKPHILNIFGREPETLDELAHCVIKVVDQERKVYGLAWKIMRGAVSNSHSCPVGGHTNFGGNKTKQGIPTSYVGWSGRLWVRYSHSPSGFGSDPFRKTLTHVGTGGFGGYDGPFQTISTARFRRFGVKTANKSAYPEPELYSWDYRIFEDDWPLIALSTQKDMMFNRLAGISPELTHNFEWQDQEIVKKDAEFISTCVAHPEKSKFI